MPRFQTRLVPGGKSPYDTWTFLVVPSAVLAELDEPPLAVRGTLQGVAFRGRLARGEGVVRMPVPADLRRAAGVGRGDRVEVELERDAAPPALELPPELAALLDGDDDLQEAFHQLAPSCRRAWAQHVAEAKRPETRARRVALAREAILAGRFPGQRFPG